MLVFSSEDTCNVAPIVVVGIDEEIVVVVGLLVDNFTSVLSISWLEDEICLEVLWIVESTLVDLTVVVISDKKKRRKKKDGNHNFEKSNKVVGQL